MITCLNREETLAKKMDFSAVLLSHLYCVCVFFPDLWKWGMIVQIPFSCTPHAYWLMAITGSGNYKSVDSKLDSKLIFCYSAALQIGIPTCYSTLDRAYCILQVTMLLFLTFEMSGLGYVAQMKNSHSLKEITGNTLEYSTDFSH